VAGDRCLPLGLVKLPSRVELLLDLLARLVKEVGLELLRRAESVLVCVKRIEGRLVDRHLLAGALLEAECAEATSELGDRQLAVAIRVELHEDLLHVPLCVALDRSVPLGLIKRPPAVERLLDGLPRLRVQGGVELCQRNLAVAIDVERAERLLIQLEFLALALLQADRAEGALQLANLQEPVARGVKLLEDLREVLSGLGGLSRGRLGRLRVRFGVSRRGRGSCRGAAAHLFRVS